MNQWKGMFLREFQENRGYFVILPAAMALVIALLVAGGVTLAETASVSVVVEEEQGAETSEQDFGSYMLLHLDRLEQMSEADRKLRIGSMLLGSSMPLLATLWIVIVFYLADSSYAERKDRSILFWKSMPLSDTQVIASKLATALLLVPIVYFCVLVTFHLLLLIIGSLSVASLGGSPGALLWYPGLMFTTWAKLLMALGFTALWCLPFFGWLMLVSAWARSRPFAWAIGLIMLIGLADAMVIPGDWLGEWIGDHLLPITDRTRDLLVHGGYLDHIVSFEFLVALVVGSGFLAAAVLLRGKGDEI